MVSVVNALLLPYSARRESVRAITSLLIKASDNLQVCSCLCHSQISTAFMHTMRPPRDVQLACSHARAHSPACPPSCPGPHMSTMPLAYACARLDTSCS